MSFRASQSNFQGKKNLLESSETIENNLKLSDLGAWSDLQIPALLATRLLFQGEFWLVPLSRSLIYAYVQKRFLCRVQVMHKYRVFIWVETASNGMILFCLVHKSTDSISPLCSWPHLFMEKHLDKVLLYNILSLFFFFLHFLALIS